MNRVLGVGVLAAAAAATVLAAQQQFPTPPTAQHPIFRAGATLVAVDVYPTLDLAEQALAEVLADEPAFEPLLLFGDDQNAILLISDAKRAALVFTRLSTSGERCARQRGGDGAAAQHRASRP